MTSVCTVQWKPWNTTVRIAGFWTENWHQVPQSMSAVHSNASHIWWMYGLWGHWQGLLLELLWPHRCIYNLLFKNIINTCQQVLHVINFCQQAWSFTLLSENETEMISITLVPVYQTTQQHILGDSNLKDTMSFVAWCLLCSNF